MEESKIKIWLGNFSAYLSGKEEDNKIIIYIFLFALILRIPLLLFPEVIHNDGIEYIRHARQIFSGDWSIGKTHPFYPALIAFGRLFVSNEEIAGILVSVIMGSLTVFPIYFLGKSIFNKKIGVLSSIFAITQPFLYMQSGSVLTEATFHFFLATSVFLGWELFNKGKLLYIVSFSLFATLAYLTRPEAIGLPMIVCLWILCSNPILKKREWRKRICLFSLTIIFFIIFSAPYLLQLRHEMGKWQISKKVTISFEPLSGEEDIEMIKVKKEFSLFSILKSPFLLIEKIGVGILKSLYIFQQVFNPILSFLLVIGFILNRRKPFLWKGHIYLISFIIYFFGFVHPFFWITRRFTSHVLSISLSWAAIGFLGLSQWINQKWREKGFSNTFNIVLLFSILIFLFIQGRVIHDREHRLIQKEAGIWMRDHLPKGAKLMSRLPQEAFYSDLQWVRMPEGSEEEIVKKAYSMKVQYIIIENEIEKFSPDFMKKSKIENLIKINEWERKNRRLTLYHLSSSY